MTDNLDVTEIATRLRFAIGVERERLVKRPVPTDPWVMPLSLDELDALAAAVLERVVVKVEGLAGGKGVLVLDALERDLKWERDEHDKARTEWLLMRDRLNGLRADVLAAVEHTQPPADYTEPMCHYGGPNEVIGAPWSWLATLIREAADDYPAFDEGADG